jgi:hypothetical protein
LLWDSLTGGIFNAANVYAVWHAGQAAELWWGNTVNNDKTRGGGCIQGVLANSFFSAVAACYLNIQSSLM